MTIVLILLGGAVALELLIYIVRPVWRWRKVLAVGALLLGSFGVGALVAYSFSLFSLLIMLLSLYRIFNLIRIVQQRMHEQYMRFATRRTGLILLMAQAVVGVLWWLWSIWPQTGRLAWTILGIAQLIGAGILLWSVRRNFGRMSWPAKHHNYTDNELPTVTVAVPARNETEDLQQCLQSIIASDYPKLEIIVLDDCSQLRRTPEIIKGFAHAGVRFIQGRDPDDVWLPKNHAYQRLTEEASGAYIVFCDVDVRFQPQTLREAIAVMLDRQKAMLSVLPRREHDAYGHLSLVQAMRYWWELVPPRRLFNRPPVLSSCWIIQTKALQELGGFGAARRSILPEAYFARALTRTDGYSFLRASLALGLTSSKQLYEQRDTGVRMRYPQLHRRPENVAALALTEITFLILPFVLAVAGWWVAIGPVALICAIISSALLIIAYQMVVLGTHINSRWFSLIGHPFMVATDIALLHYSMWKYEFSTVEWKGRNVCIPVMHVVSHLPKI